MAFERREYSGNAPDTTLATTITNLSTSIVLASGTGYPTGSTGGFYIVIDPGTASEEKVLCTSRSGSTITVGSRGADGTTATSHTSGATIRHVLSAVDADEANRHYADTGLDHHTQYLNTTRHAAISHGEALIADGAITTAKLADGSVTTAKLASATLSELRLARTTNQSVSGSTLTAISWNSETADVDGYISAPSSTITVPSGKGGLFIITFRTDPQSATYWYPQITAGGVSYVAGEEAIESNSPLTLTICCRLAQADTVICYVKHNSGSAVNFRGTLTMVRLAA